MARRWTGDDQNRLPAHKIEPYRLWFEFLKLAITDKTLKVNYRFYKPWKIENNQTFDEWWKENWRDLFSVDVGVYEIKSPSSIVPGKHEIFVRIPLFQNPNTSIEQVKNILKENSATQKLSNLPQGNFHIFSGVRDDGTIIDPSIRFLKNLEKIRLYLHLYKHWLKNGNLSERNRMQKSCLDYFLWAENWNQKIRYKKDGTTSKRNPHVVPEAVYYYSQYLLIRGSRGKISRDEMIGNDIVDNIMNYQGQVSRYFMKARKIAENVSNGQFPGKYE